MTAAAFATAAVRPLAAPRDLLLALSASIAALIALSLAFAVATLAWHHRHAVIAARRARLERIWTPLVLEVLAGERAPHAVTDAVARRDRAWFADLLLRLAQRLRGREVAALAELAAPVLDDVAAQLRSARPDLRARAIVTLGALAPERHAAAVAAALDDPAPIVAITAARALAQPGAGGQVAAVLAVLPRFADWSPTFLASMLAAAGPGTAPALRGLLADSARPARSRVVAAEALRILRDLPAAAPAAAVVAAGGDTDLVTSALRVLGAVGTPSEAVVVRAAMRSADPVVRAQACAALGTRGDAGDASRLAAALDDDDLWVVFHAARSLRALGGGPQLEAAIATRPRAAETVRQVLAEEPA